MFWFHPFEKKKKKLGPLVSRAWRRGNKASNRFLKTSERRIKPCVISSDYVKCLLQKRRVDADKYLQTDIFDHPSSGNVATTSSFSALSVCRCRDDSCACLQSVCLSVWWWWWGWGVGVCGQLTQGCAMRQTAHTYFLWCQIPVGVTHCKRVKPASPSCVFLCRGVNVVDPSPAYVCLCACGEMHAGTAVSQLFTLQLWRCDLQWEDEEGWQNTDGELQRGWTLREGGFHRVSMPVCAQKQRQMSQTAIIQNKWGADVAHRGASSPPHWATGISWWLFLWLFLDCTLIIAVRSD